MNCEAHYQIRGNEILCYWSEGKDYFFARSSNGGKNWSAPQAHSEQICNSSPQNLQHAIAC